MPRKTWTPQTEVTPSLLKLREKRKWQIALRRYVLERNPSVFYAPYFGLDIENLRNWFEMQFESGVGWEDFSKKWQFGHIIPVTFFDFSNDDELRLCWNFTNIRVESPGSQKEKGNQADILAARGYFDQLYKKTLYRPCLRLLEKIEEIERAEVISTVQQKNFILAKRDYLEEIKSFDSAEFELLNRGRTLEEVKKEMEFVKKFNK